MKENDGDCDWLRELAKVERSSYESIRVDDAQGDGDSHDGIIRGKEKGIY
jgi:hypothetical protein